MAARPFQMSAPTKGGCYSCMYWEGEGVQMRGPHGSCHRSPPTISDRAPDGKFPRTLSTDWCGEWAPTPLKDQEPGWETLDINCLEDTHALLRAGRSQDGFDTALQTYMEQNPGISLERSREAVKEKIKLARRNAGKT